MKIYHCDIWSLADRADAICITTNGLTKANGEAVMGKGIALQARQRFPGIDRVLGDHLRYNGNIPGIIKVNPTIVSFPTKNDWRDKSDLDLIEKSAKFFAAMIEKHGWHKVVMPKPGCANGGLRWPQVEPIIDRWLPSVFICDR